MKRKDNMKKISCLLVMGIMFIASYSIKSQVSLPYATGFETMQERNDWVVYKDGSLNSPYTWSENTDHASSGSYGIFHDYNVGGDISDTIIDWLVSPQILNGSLSSISLDVYGENMGGVESVDYFGVWVSFGSPNPENGDFIEISNLSNFSLNWVFKDTTVFTAFLPPPPSDFYIAFRYKSTNHWYSIGIDNVSINGNVTSVKEESNDLNRTEIYPNPTKNRVNIRAVNPISNLRICNLEGKIVYFDNDINEEKSIDVTSFKKGIYVMKYYIEEQLYIDKVIVQ